MKVDGKIRRQSLETDDYSLAKERLPATLESLRGATAAKAFDPWQAVPLVYSGGTWTSGNPLLQIIDATPDEGQSLEFDPPT